ncbi:MAG: NUDIX domain-containing protein [Gammaproteobacteria bacterium]
MNLRTDTIDLWVFCRDAGVARYLMLHTSQEKADRWFGGGRFWQIPGAFLSEGESVVSASRRCLTELALSARSIWAIEHVYPIYNRRYESLMLIPVFAAEVDRTDAVQLSWEHSEFRWCTAEECKELVSFRGLLEGLEWTRTHVTESAAPRAEFQIG